MIVVGDVGGTRARLALYDAAARKRLVQVEYPSRNYLSLEAVLADFMREHALRRVRAVCVGVAGPVIDGRCKATNLPWVVDTRRLAKVTGTLRVSLINDLVALSYGCLSLSPRRKRVLRGHGVRKVPKGNVAVIAAGTGLGEAVLVSDAGRIVPCATEGGHTDFAPRNALEVELWEYLSRKHKGRVSYERIVSGPGVSALYDFFLAKHPREEKAANTRNIANAADRNAVIGELAARSESPIAVRALDLFAAIYGAEAGNLALKCFATGGVFVAGQISVGLLSDPRRRELFVKAFLDKGRMGALLESVPMTLALDSDVGLSGSVQYAVRTWGLGR